MGDAPFAFYVLDERGQRVAVRERSPLWHRMRNARPGEVCELAGYVYERLDDDVDEGDGDSR